MALRSAKDALEERVLVRRQVAWALQLVERAVAAEAHAVAWSEAVAPRADHARADINGDEEDPHYDVMVLPARKNEELRRFVEAEERKAEARVVSLAGLSLHVFERTHPAMGGTLVDASRMRPHWEEK